MEESIDRPLEIRRLDQRCVDDLFLTGVRPDDELLAKVCVRSAGGGSAVPYDLLAAVLFQDKDRTVLVIGTGFRKRRKAGQNQLFSGPRAAKDIAAGLTAFRVDTLDWLAEVVEAFETDAV